MEQAGCKGRRDGPSMTARSTLRLGVFAIVAFALGLVLARMLLSPGQPTAPAMENATVFPAPRSLPPLSLIGQDGQPLTTDFFRDGWTMVFFGFTSCPDVCPTTLALLAQVRRELTDMPAAQQPRVLLVSVDPERDTPEKLKAYVSFFDESFLGATGTLEQVEHAAGAFMVPFVKVPTPDGNYTLDHGSGLFFVAPSGAIVAYSSPPFQPQALARDYRATVRFFEEST
jgi:protein SCO1